MTSFPSHDGANRPGANVSHLPPPAPLGDAPDRLRLYGRSPAHLEVLDRLTRVARVGVEILLCGPTGVGKELYARFTHAAGPRPGGPFVPLNCGAVPPALFENELFGHSAGAYTGAAARSEGLVAAADGGTLFLDEVDSLAPAAQVKLLRLLQDREYRRLGETRVRRADCRFIAATNTDLAAAVAAGRFREDLYFRLQVVPVVIRPLRDRPEDVSVLLVAFVRRYAAEYGVAPLTFTPEAADRLAGHAWPGNVRELENLVRGLTCLQPGRPVEADELPLPAVAGGPAGDVWGAALRLGLRAGKRLVVEAFEREYLEAALRRAGGNIMAAARASGKHRRALFELIRKHRIRADRFRPAGGLHPPAHDPEQE